MAVIHVGTEVTLASIPTASVSNNDIAYIWLNLWARKMVFDATSEKAEDTANHPYYVRPDDYSTGGVWVEAVGADDPQAWDGSSVATGVIHSVEWPTSGSEIDLDAGTIKLGGSASPAFSVTAAGVLTATGAVITGNITAESGFIGGFTIQDDQLFGGTIESANIFGVNIQTASSGPRISITTDGISLIQSDTTGKYGTFKYGTTPYGSGILAVIWNSSFNVPFYIVSSTNYADFHFYNRSGNPSGASEEGDVCAVSETLKLCTAAGTPGTWKALAMEAGGTGGSGSAGAGNQYVELNIDGTVYKLLHDGTV